MTWIHVAMAALTIVAGGAVRLFVAYLAALKEIQLLNAAAVAREKENAEKRIEQERASAATAYAMAERYRILTEENIQTSRELGLALRTQMGEE